jgi:hypothetical protein
VDVYFDRVLTKAEKMGFYKRLGADVDDEEIQEKMQEQWPSEQAKSDQYSTRH